MKNILTINPAIAENTECLIVKACAPIIDLKWVCRFNKVYHCALFHLRLFEHLANISSRGGTTSLTR